MWFNSNFVLLKHQDPFQVLALPGSRTCNDVLCENDFRMFSTETELYARGIFLRSDGREYLQWANGLSFSALTEPKPSQ